MALSSGLSFTLLCSIYLEYRYVYAIHFIFKTKLLDPNNKTLGCRLLISSPQIGAILLHFCTRGLLLRGFHS